MNQKQRQRKLQEFKYNAVKKGMKSEATDVAINIMNTVPLLVLRDKYGFGAKRLTEFHEHMSTMIKDIEEGRIDFVDIITVLKDEVNFEIELPERRYF
ncbi:hypothetical protein GUI37_06095 [Helcococcus kunzii]|uniref:hypothetical protein n=1 Tax=Helcococcus kunzii TaxID=40091 RepID=UPI001BAF8B33|nr:hypothetical protein [Helcococcus kunzii]QUY65111.1 hypothetical protein GUI37_06095 [Helcococcus kunzii]